jgi:endonuclease G
MFLLVLLFQLQGLLNISGASTASTSNYLVVKRGYVMSYNGNEGKANWVAWRLRASDLGPVPRSNRFKEDTELPDSFLKADSDDYKGSGYDRGHLCPSEDRTATFYLNQETFLMSNMLPQTPELNRGPWKFLEEYCRKLAQRGSELEIYTGSLGSIDRLSGSRIPIPAYFWKVIKYNDGIICVLIPNAHALEKNWKKYQISLQELEKLTKYKFG